AYAGDIASAPAAGRNVHDRAAWRAGASNGGADRTAEAPVTRPARPTSTSTSTDPSARAFTGYTGAFVCAGNGTRGSAVVTSFGGVPTVGTMMLGAPNTASTRTCASIGFCFESSAGVKRHVFTACMTSSVKGGVDRRTSI